MVTKESARLRITVEYLPAGRTPEQVTTVVSAPEDYPANGNAWAGAIQATLERLRRELMERLAARE